MSDPTFSALQSGNFSVNENGQVSINGQLQSAPPQIVSYPNQLNHPLYIILSAKRRGGRAGERQFKERLRCSNDPYSIRSEIEQILSEINDDLDIDDGNFGWSSEFVDPDKQMVSGRMNRIRKFNASPGSCNFSELRQFLWVEQDTGKSKKKASSKAKSEKNSKRYDAQSNGMKIGAERVRKLLEPLGNLAKVKRCHKLWFALCYRAVCT